jgi:hypothetical protein
MLPLVAQHLLNRAQDATLAHVCSMLLAFARLNFRPEHEDQFFSLVWALDWVEEGEGPQHLV